MTEPRHVVVIGGGIAGLSAAHRLITAAGEGAAPQVTVLEASDRLGGWIRTEPFAGRPVDFGPDSLLARTPWAVELCRELALDDELVSPGAGQSLIYARGKLRTLPSGILAGLPNGPMPFVRSGLLGPLGLARAAADLVLPANAPAGGADESIGALIRRRLGRQALDRVIDPLLGGVHAGRCDDLSLQSTAPQIAAAAAADRSLLRGLRATAPPTPPAGSAPRPVFVAPKAGMQTITDALIAELRNAGVQLRTGAVANALKPAPVPDGPITITLAGDEQLVASDVILAVPARAAAELLEPQLGAPAIAPLRELRYASVAQVALEYGAEGLPPLPAATGFLVARGEPLLITACTLLDAKWPKRRELLPDAPTTAVIKCSVGRIDDTRHAALSDEQLVDAIHADLSRTLGLSVPPVSARAFRVERGLPQYAPGHRERIAGLTGAAQAALPGLRLAGAAYTGTSVPMCVRSGRAAADAVLAAAATPAG